MKFNAEELYQRIKTKPTKYKEEVHCPLILDIMNNPSKGRLSAFCVEAAIGETTFYDWTRRHKVFAVCYEMGKMMARENWEIDGMNLRHDETPIGTLNHSFEHWRMVGWSRFGVGKNSRIRLNLSEDGTPSGHYKELLKQASEGDFTAGEIKQLMEAINVGLNAYQVFELQKQIDELKSDLIKINDINYGKNNYTNKGIA